MQTSYASMSTKMRRANRERQLLLKRQQMRLPTQSQSAVCFWRQFSCVPFLVFFWKDCVNLLKSTLLQMMDDEHLICLNFNECLINSYVPN